MFFFEEQIEPEKETEDSVQESVSKCEMFEKECTDYLNSLGIPDLKFVKRGGKDSTIPDIEIIKLEKGDDGRMVEKTTDYFIECKMNKAQGGQFVLKEDEKGNFIINTRGSKVNSYIVDNSKLADVREAIKKKVLTEESIKALSAYKTAFSKEPRFPGVSSIFYRSLAKDKDKELASSVLSGSYNEKNVLFVMTQDANRNIVILPMNENTFEEEFRVDITYRAIINGSGDLAKKTLNSKWVDPEGNLTDESDFIVKLKQLLQENDKDNIKSVDIKKDNIKSVDIKYDSKKAYVVLNRTTENSIFKTPCYFNYSTVSDDTTKVTCYKIAQETIKPEVKDSLGISNVPDSSTLRIRKLANTFSPTVIFSLEYIGNKGLNKEDFEEKLINSINSSNSSN